MQLHRVSSRLLTLSCLLLLLGATTGAQQTADSQVADSDGAGSEGDESLSTFFEVSNTTVVNIDVYVEDKKGNPVTGLTIDDFELYEERNEVRISNFFAVEGGVPATESVGELPTSDAPRRSIELPELPTEQQLHLIIYIDNFNLFPATRNRTLARLRSFLSSNISKGDKVMVVSYDRSLHMRQPFTADMFAVNSALEELEKLSGHGTLRERERKSAIDEITTATRELTALGAARDYAESVQAEMQFTMRGLSRQVELLAGLTGRKAVLYVSDGLPQVIGEDIFTYVDERFPRSRARLESGNFDIANEYRTLVTQANSSGVTFFTLDASGMRARSSISAEYGGTAQGGGLPLIDSIYTANMREPLHMIADDTGGRAIVGTNAIKAGLGKIMGDLRNYYSLGYQPSHSGGGRYYRLEVKTKRKGLKVRHRLGYRDKTSESRLAESTLASLIYGLNSNPLGVDLGFGRSSADGKASLVPVEVKIPLEKVALIPQSGSYLGRLKLAFAVMDGDGGMSPVEQRKQLTIQIPEAELEMARSKYYTYELTLNMRPGLTRVAVSVRDEHSASTSHVRRTVKIGS